MDSELMTMTQIAKTFGYSLAHLRRLSSQKAIKAEKTDGRTMYFRVTDVLPALKNHKFKARKLETTGVEQTPVTTGVEAAPVIESVDTACTTHSGVTIIEAPCTAETAFVEPVLAVETPTTNATNDDLSKLLEDTK